MVKVENKETLRLLTKRFMKMNRARNIIAVIAIMLTSLLFTSLFVGSVSMILSKRATEIKQFMDSSHAIAQNLSEEDAERLQKTIEQSDEVERYGTGIFLGAGRDKHFGFSVEVRYADKNMAESFNCLPTTGRLPEKENEVAVSSLVLEALGVTPKIGEEVTLTWEVNPMLKQYKTDTFQICGFWQGASSRAHPVLFFQNCALIRAQRSSRFRVVAQQLFRTGPALRQGDRYFVSGQVAQH